MTADVFTQWCFLLAAAAGLVAFAFHRHLAVLAAAATLLFFAADEELELHERLGEWAERRGADLPLLQDLDSAVLAAYGLAWLVLVVAAWRPLMARTASKLAVASGFVLGAVALAMDALVPHGARFSHAEEFFEGGSAAAFAAAFVAHAAAAVGDWLGGRAAVAPGGVPAPVEPSE